MGLPDQRSKQVEGDKIVAHVAVLDGALHLRINRALDQVARTLEEFRRASSDAIQCGSDDLLGRNVVHKGNMRYSQS
jgi:hypothetical protein